MIKCLSTFHSNKDHQILDFCLSLCSGSMSDFCSIKKKHFKRDYRKVKMCYHENLAKCYGTFY